MFKDENGKDLNLGFVLFDGSNLGISAYASRNGLERIWDWGETPYSYEIHLGTDGWGQYYDFSFVPEGEKRKPKDVWQCIKNG